MPHVYMCMNMHVRLSPVDGTVLKATSTELRSPLTCSSPSGDDVSGDAGEQCSGKPQDSGAGSFKKAGTKLSTTNLFFWGFRLSFLAVIAACGTACS